MLVELKNIKKYFPCTKSYVRRTKFVKAVDGVDLVIKRGENLGLVENRVRERPLWAVLF